jgi:hypothetical protein
MSRRPSRLSRWLFAVPLVSLLLAVARAHTAADPAVLAWDGGESEAGSQAVAQPSTAAGRYFFRVSARAAEVWRTRLTVTAGEADLYLAKGEVPVPGAEGTIAAAQAGSDGLLLGKTKFGAGETWYLLVDVPVAGSEWSLVSGSPYIHDLGTLPYTDANADGTYNIGEASQDGGVAGRVMGPEGVAFFKVTLPPNVPAWALWMNGGQELLGVRKNQVPVLFDGGLTADRKRNGSLLLVPPYLGQGSDSYFVSVSGTPGSTYSLDSRIQQIEDMDFEGTVPSIAVTGSPYRVFRVEVPAEQVIWDLSLEPLSGDPNLCVSKQTVPAESDNEALSEAAGGVRDSITLVSPDLTNGTWFITLFGSGPYETNLVSGTPAITDIGYRSTVANDQPERGGWRYYRVPDIGAQLGTLGWQLELENAPPGTEISLRRALAPGTWKRKAGGAAVATSVRHVDFSSATGILQRVDHEADIWYVGVYQPDTALGNFTLTLRDIVATAGAFDDHVVPVSGQIEGEWRYFRINVPDDPALLGWYLDLSGVSGTTTAKITVRRDRLPPAPPGSPAVTAASSLWPSGANWAQTADFTGVMQDFGGAGVAGNHFLAAAGPYRPLQAGTYYVGVLAGSLQPPPGPVKTVSYQLRSRGIGGGHAIPVTPLDPAGGSVTLTDLAPRDFRFFSLTIPAGAQVPAWALTLNPTAGDLLMQVRRDSLPDFSTSALVGENVVTGAGVGTVVGGKRMKRSGGEKLTLLPEHGEAFLQPGTYYAAVVSEGATPTTAALGEAAASGTLGSTTDVPVTDLGVVTGTASATAFDLPGGDLAVYRLTVPAGARVLEAWLSGRGGNPGISLVKGEGMPKPWPGTTTVNNGYGWVGGQNAPTHPVLVSVPEPEAGVYTLIVRANAEGANFPNGAGTLHLRVVESLPELQVLGPATSLRVDGQLAESWRYFTLTVPENPALKGIHLTLRDVSSGLPRMVIRKGSGLPRDFTTTAGLNSDSIAWPDDAQWTQANDFTAITKNSAGATVSGRGFLCAYDAPMGPGVYTIGVAKDATVNTVTVPNSPDMAYTIRVEAVGEGLDLDVVPLAPDNTAAPELIPALAERHLRFFKVSVPEGMASWRMKLSGSVVAGPPALYHDGMMAIRKGRLPAFDIGADPSLKGGMPVKILNQDDHWVILPKTADGVIEGGDYYVAVTSLGLNPTTTQSGGGTCDLTLETRGELPLNLIPPLSTGEETLVPYSLGPAEVAAYEFTVPARAEGLTPYGFVISRGELAGTSNFSLRMSGPDGGSSPLPPGPGADGFTGGLPAQFSSSASVGGQIVYQATPGTYRVIVRSCLKNGAYAAASGRLELQLIDSGAGIPTLQFDGENFAVSNGGAVTDILPFRVIVPDEPNWKAWGIRLDGPHSGKPAILIRRDQPVEATAVSGVDSNEGAWPSLASWTQIEDYTKLRNDPYYGTSNDKDRSQQYFVAARDRPLQPGTYYVGIDNRGTHLISPRSFTLRTFAFGEGYTVPVSDLAEVGATAAISIDDPRMPSVHKITIPAQTRAWAVALTPTLGDFTLRVRKGFIPDPVNSGYPDLDGGVMIQKAGNERFTLLPKAGADFLEPGDYYLAAVSEGQGPSIATKTIGTGIATATLANLGPPAVSPLGLVGPAGLAQPLSLEAAEVKFFTVEVPPGVNNLQFRLNDRAGEASIVVIPGTRLPSPLLATENYGVFGGETGAALRKDKAIVNLGNPAAGTYTIAVRAGGVAPSAYAPASATLAVDILNPVPLNFSPDLNAGNGFSNTDARSLADKQKYFYRVAIPEQIEGEEVLGWLVTLDLGSPVVRFYRSEADFGKTAPVTMAGRTALIVPPLLGFGTNWFIEVEGVGTTDYAIRSEPVALAAAPWTLPSEFNRHAGDSNPGEPDGVGAGRQLSQDFWEFYALDVPADNLGLMRLVLEASNGNPNVYIRQGAIPTTDHRSTGVSGTILHDHKMISEDSEAGNFSAVSDLVAQPDRLSPGLWFIGVKSDPVGSTRTSSRYRLKAHSGVVSDLDLSTAEPLTGQNLAEKDWRYYRVTIPREGIPTNWLPAFTRLHGTAQLYIRDTIPPFSYVKNTVNSAASITFQDWGTDTRNKVATGAYLKTPAPGAVSLPVPPLRPGSTYYLGFYGASGGAFEVSSSLAPGQLALDAEMSYDAGSSSFEVPAGQKRLIRFRVPPEATRLKFDCVQSAAGLVVKLEQGAPPDLAAGVSAHLQTPAVPPASFIVNRALGTQWPFVPDQDYYLLLSNPTAAAIGSTVTMKGVNAQTEDEDLDGLPDVWERGYFPSHTTYNAAADPDLDGSTNLQEFLNGTLPNNIGSAIYPLAVLAPGGTVTVSPQQTSFNRGDPVTLVATPAAGDSFLRWNAAGTPADGSAMAEVSFPVTSNVSATAIFATSLGRALDTPAAQVWSTSGTGAWFGQYEHSHDGVDAASSPPLATGGSASLSTSLTGPGTLGFRWKVSSRAASHVLALLIDGVVQPGGISGTTMTGWADVSVAIPAGNHTVTWRYAKGAGSAQGLDRGWVDQVSYSGFPAETQDYAAWNESRFTLAERADPAISGPDADPDGDGLANLLEAALGLGPKSADPAGEALKVTGAAATGGTRGIRLECKVAGQGVSNITLRLESAADLSSGGWGILATKSGAGGWASQPSVTANEADTGAAREAVVFEETLPVAGSGRRYYRLAAEVVP